MHLERYEIERPSPGSNVFRFVSEGPNGAIEKAVVFSPMPLPNLYNLAFGDVNRLTGELDDLSISDNGDTQIILATVAAIVIAFTEEQPGAMIYATGSTPARTRLYQMGITAQLDEMKIMFSIFGLRNDEWEPFRKGVSYEAFYVRRTT